VNREHPAPTVTRINVERGLLTAHPPASQLQELAKPKDQGILTEEEFQAKTNRYSTSRKGRTA